MENVTIKRTHGRDPDFSALLKLLDEELWNELMEDQATYEPHNQVDDVATALVLYVADQPIASGCLRAFSSDTAEIKRMFVRKPYRGRGLSRLVLSELETWAMEEGYSFALLETSVRFSVAIRLYESSGYRVIPNYGPYLGLSESVCMKKDLQPAALLR
ncbi:MAG TPA: GNAT family N-acetyltransferase [Chitinophagaceae bacterium]|nr:GNAT family N-acetyltransferase [Chitinophagaceae bacterium]